MNVSDSANFEQTFVLPTEASTHKDTLPTKDAGSQGAHYPLVKRYALNPSPSSPVTYIVGSCVVSNIGII